MSDDSLVVLSDLFDGAFAEKKPDEALKRIIETLPALLKCMWASIWLYNKTDKRFVLMTASSQVLPPDRERLVRKLVAKVSTTRQLKVFAHGEWDGEELSLDGTGVGAAIGAPLLWRGELFGVLVVVDSLEGGAFDWEDVQLVRLVASQASLVLANVHLLSRNKQLENALLEEQNHLSHIQVATRQMLDNPDMKANLTGVAEALQALGWRKVVIALYSEELEIVELMAAGLSDEEQRGYRMAILPDDVWQQYVKGELEGFRLNGLYYVPRHRTGRVWEPGDVLFAPLRLGQGGIMGVIRVDDPIDGSRPRVDTLRPLDILVSQAAYLLENARLLGDAEQSAETLAEQVDELSMIHRADRELGEHLNVDRVMTLTMDWALRRTGADTGLLALVTRDQRGVVPFVTLGYLDHDIMTYTEQAPLLMEQGIIAQTIQSGRTHIVRDVQHENEPVDFMPKARSVISIPLSMRGEVLGIIILASSEEREFDKNDASFLERLARRAAVALDNARLFRQSEQLADDMAVLYSASRTITSTLERDEVLQRIAQSMAVVLECSSAVILDYRADVRRAQVLAVYQLGTAQDVQENLPEVKESISLDAYPTLVQAIEQKHPLVIRADDPDILDEYRALMEAYRMYAAFITPLVSQNELIGLAFVIEGRHDRCFTSSEVFKAETLASQASVALRQSMLFSEVRELEKVKSEMIRMASHDLRNPLNNLMGYIELVAASIEDAGISPSQEEYIASLRRSTSIMKSLIDDLLTLERIESQQKNDWQAFDLSGLVYEVVESAQASARLKHQTLTLDRQAAVPLVFGNVTQLRQAVSNLVDNAIKYTPEEGQIDVTFVYQDHRLHIRVRDTGYGISKERQERLFERFYRAREPGTDHIPGTGLGLSLVKVVVERHGGEVWFESEPGKGSTFGFWLPAIQ
jgi:signal transduction histidine kinase